MITLTGRRLIAECDVFGDDTDALMAYVMPKAPRVAKDDEGVPMVHLVWWRRPVDQLTAEERATRLGGGILTVSTDLAPTDEEEKEIRRTLAADPSVRRRAGALANDPVALAAAIKIAAVPVKDGTVSIAVLAENPAPGAAPGEMVANLVGVGRVSATGVGRSSFMAKLTQDGVALLWELIEKNLQPIRVEYDITFDHRLTGVTMIVHCDVQKAYHATQEVWAHISDDARFSDTTSGNSSHHTFSRDQKTDAGNVLSTIATDAEAIEIKIIPEAGPEVITPELITQLTTQANAMVTEFLASTFLEVNPEFTQDEEPTLQTQLATYDGKAYGHHGIDYYKLKKVDLEATGSLDYKLTTKAVVTGHLTPNDNLSNVTDGQPVEKFRTMVEIDPAFYKYLAVQVLCTADFETEPVDLVRGRLRYQQGGINEVKDVLFSKTDLVPKEFATYLASPSARQYDYEYEVFYKGTPQTLKRTGRSDGDVLVLDTDALGIVKVDLQCGVVDFDRIASVTVELWIGTGTNRKEQEFTLTSGHDHDTWVAITADAGTEPYHYQCTFVDKQGQRIVDDEQTSTSKSLVIEQPISETLEVAVIPAGSFGAEGLISRVVVALRYKDAANNYTVDDLITLTGDTDTKSWSVPLVDTKLRGYEYRVTVFYSDGVTREDDWTPTDKTILPVGDPFGMRVQILPYRLKLSGLYEFGTIHLSFKDQAANIVSEKDLQIVDFTQPLYWRFRLGAPDRHTYSYQLTLFTTDGRELALPEATETREVLTLAPPGGVAVLDASGRFEVDNVAVFPDGTRAGGFYAVSLTPQLATDEDGRPTVSLAVYGSRSAGVFSAAGAVLTLTTELAIGTAEASRLRQRLAARLAAGRPAESTEPIPAPELLAPEWVEASVEVRLTKDLVLTGTPSMGAQNRCSFSTQLTDEGADQLVRAWRAGLPDAQITYRGRLRSGAAGGGRFAGGSSGGTSVSRSRVTTSTTRTTTTHTSSSSSSSSSSSAAGAEPPGDDCGPDVTTTESHTSTSWTSGEPPQAADVGAAATADPGPAPAARPDADRIAATSRLRDSLPDPSDSLLITEM